MSKTDPSVHVRMLLTTQSNPSHEDQVKYGLFESGGQWFHPTRSQDSLVSTDVKEVTSFLKGMVLTMGFTVAFAIDSVGKTVSHIPIFKIRWPSTSWKQGHTVSFSR